MSDDGPGRAFLFVPMAAPCRMGWVSEAGLPRALGVSKTRLQMVLYAVNMLHMQSCEIEGQPPAYAVSYVLAKT